MNNKKILIVDDEPANVLLLSKMLSVHGYNNVITTINPNDAIILYQENDIDLILLDINMPVMSGYQVLEALRSAEDFNDIPVIALSGDINPEQIKKALDAGFTSYITKPIKMQALLEFVEEALQGSS